MGEQNYNSKRAFGRREIVVLVCLIAFFAWATFQPINGVHSTSPKNACINNLRLIDAAKQQWAIENKKAATDTPTWDELKLYFGRARPGQMLCPSGGIYTIGTVTTVPTCSIAGHAISN